MNINELINYLLTLQSQGKGNYKVVNGEYGYETDSDNEHGNLEVKDETKKLIIW